jgi:hypothetical protein
MLSDVTPTPQEAAGAPGGGTEAAGADSVADASGDEDEGEGGQPDEEEDDQPGEEEDDQPDELDSDLFGEDPFAEDDTTSVSDSTLWGMPEDTLAADDGAPDDEAEEGQDGQPEGQAPTQQLVGAGRVYPPGTILEFQILEFGVMYPHVKRRLLVLGTASIGRLAGVYLQVRQIEGPGGEIVQVASGRSHHQDRLSGRSRILAEGATYPFTKPELPPGRIGKLAEPIVVMGIVGSLVYLFYQNQN